MSVQDQANNPTTYTRDIQGNVTGITQGSITRSFAYDQTKKNFLTLETNPETGTITYGRDNVGNMTSKSDASGTTSYGYNNINRQTSINSNITFGYDNANNRTSMTYPGGSATYTYDAANRQTQKNETIGSRDYITGYTPDDNDNIHVILYPSGRSVTYGYNGNNQVTSVTGFGGSVTTVNYSTTGNTAGLPTSLILSNGISSTFGYNTRNLPTSITAGSALNVGYGYDDTRGNTTSYTNYSDTAKNQIYGYDSLSRLTSFSGAWGSGSYAYDATGNRTNKTVAGNPTTYSYTGNRVASATGGEPATYSYRGEGVLTGGTWQGTNYVLGYDSLDNLASVSSGSTVLASFSYDGDGQRVIKTANGNATVYHYDQAGHAISENDGSGNLLTDYVYLKGKLIAKVAATPTISGTPATDNFGTVIVNTSTAYNSFSIKNAGTGGLVIGSVGVTGSNAGDFTETSDGCSGHTLGANASCIIQVTFSPISAGAKNANLTIPTNDANTPTFNAALSGVAILPVLTATKVGTGGGSINSVPSGISCGATCSNLFNTGSAVTLTATPDLNSSFTGWSGGGCSGTATCTVTLNANTTVTSTFTYLSPVASFSATPTSGVATVAVVFTDTSLRATSWLWTFGDGTTSTLQNPSHTYTSPGSYSVTLQASNTISGSNSLTQTNLVTVTAPPAISVTPTSDSFGLFGSIPRPLITVFW